jgi:hypothetical protein
MLKRICLLESIIDPYINRGLDYRGGPLGFERHPSGDVTSKFLFSNAQ